MPRCRVVAPRTKRLLLSDGDWIEVKEELNSGEQRRVFTNIVKAMEPGKPLELNPEQVGKTKVVEYITDWSLVDEDGRLLPNHSAEARSNSLDSIDPASYAEIVEAVDKHDEAAEKARDARKNVQAGPSGSTPTSLLPVG